MKKSLKKKASKRKLVHLSIDASQNTTLLNLKMHAYALRNCAQALIDKIESEGLSGYYSQNHDCARHSNNVWLTSLKLGMLRSLKNDIIT